LKHWAIDWRIVVGAGALVLAAAIAMLSQFFRKPDDPEDEERRRRSQLNQVGRIVEGLVVELVESQAPAQATADSDGASRSKGLVPAAASAGFVAPMVWRAAAIAFVPSSAMTTTGDETM